MHFLTKTVTDCVDSTYLKIRWSPRAHCVSISECIPHYAPCTAYRSCMLWRDMIRHQSHSRLAPARVYGLSFPLLIATHVAIPSQSYHIAKEGAHAMGRKFRIMERIWPQGHILPVGPNGWLCPSPCSAPPSKSALLFSLMTVIPYSCSEILGFMFFTGNPSRVMFLHGNHRG